MKDWFGGDLVLQSQNTTGVISKNSAAYLQYVDMVTDKVLEVVSEIPFVKNSHQDTIRSYVRAAAEIRIESCGGINNNLVADVIALVTPIFKRISE